MTAIAPPQPQIIYPSSDGEPGLELEVLLEQYRSQFGELPGHPTTES